MTTTNAVCKFNVTAPKTNAEFVLVNAVTGINRRFVS